MYEKLIETARNCHDENISCIICNCPYIDDGFPDCQNKLISELANAIETLESNNAWNEQAVKHLKKEIDRINVDIHKVLNENAGLISQWLSQKIRQVLTNKPNGEQNESLYN